MTTKQILLIDGSSFIFRAFYAVRDLTAPDGTPTNAIYGIISMIKQLQKKYQTPYWVCVFDAKGKTFRDDLYPAYKATRKETPSDLKIQIPLIHEIIQDLGIPIIIQNGVEADDVIATIAKHYAKLDYSILIATGDKDFAQIVDENITLINTMTNETLDIAGVINKFGVTPNQIIDYLTLIGDTVDNIPGVHKCGAKTAQKWLKQYDNLANLIAHKDEITGAIGKNLQEALSWLPLSKQLITIDTEVNIDNFNIDDINDLTIKQPNYTKLISAFSKLNFRTWLKEINQQIELPTLGSELNSPINPSATHKQLKLVDSEQELHKIADKLIALNEPIAIQLINQNHSDYKSAIAMVLIETQEINYYYTISYNDNNTNDLFTNPINNNFYLITKQLFEAKLPKVIFDYKHLLYQCQEIDITPQNIIGDIKLASYVKKSTANHELTAIINDTLNKHTTDLTNLFGKNAKLKTFAEITTEEQLIYLNDISYILPCYNKLIDSLDTQENYIYNQIELPISKILFEMELSGITLDNTKITQLHNTLQHELNNLENQIYQQSGQVFNINSPKQLQDILFNQMGCPTTNIRKIASGYSTDEESLSILADQGIPIANQLLEYRSLAKLLNTYVTKLPHHVDLNNKLHTTFEQTTVTSGRLSSKEPNLQNIPIRNSYGQQIRECFTASPKHLMVCADYSQIELRILAHISQDANLIKAFHDNLDIHTLTASQIFGKTLDQVTKEERRYAKSINFGLIYGKSVFGLAKELKIERVAAKTYIDNYFAQFPKVQQYMSTIKQQAHANQYVSTIMGRKIYLPNIKSTNKILSQADERLALNAPMQGSAADIIKVAMINIANWLQQHNLASKLILQVHDELIFDVVPDELELIMQNIPQLMANSCSLAVPLTVEIKAADNWNNAH